MLADSTKMARGRHVGMRQQGVAVVTALLLTTLSITIVTSLFWQQHVQVRSIENQQLQLQNQWILRGALDWARLVLSDDANRSSIDHLGESWAVPLTATELEGHLDRERTGMTDSVLSGSIIDAQSRFNLKNLAPDGNIDRREVAAFRRMLTSLRLDPRLAQPTAELIASTHAGPAAASDAEATGGNRGASGANAVSHGRALGLQGTDDLLAVAGMTPAILAKLQDFIVVLPQRTAVNVNTATAQVLAAKIEGLSVADAAVLVAGRERAYIRDDGDLALRLQGKTAEPPGKDLSLSTSYFLVNANVRVNKGSLKMQALMVRNFMTGSKLVWVREY